MTTLSSSLHEWLKKKLPDFKEIQSLNTLSGGDINEVYKLQTNAGDYVVKVNDPNRFPGMFKAEKQGLELLSRSGITTPEVIGYDESADLTFLVLKFVASGPASPAFWQTFAEDLATMHKQSSSHFGLSHPNYMGSLVQPNEQKDSWPEFFVTQRLEPQLKMAYDAGFLQSLTSAFAKLMIRLENMVPTEKPAVVHGDLWSGNFIGSKEGTPVLIDPAAHYGHREADIAMMHLFGGFDASLFRYYNTIFPLEAGWKERIDLHNLYPLLVHVNLFGGGYEGQVAAIIKHFIH